MPLDDIITDATTVLDRYAGHDEDIIARLRHLLYRAREIRSLIHKAGSTIAPQPKQSPPATAPRLAGTRILVVDADESIRRSAHHLLGSQGASVETARDAHEAIALIAADARTRRPWSTSGFPTSTATRPTSGCGKSSPACRSS